MSFLGPCVPIVSCSRPLPPQLWMYCIISAGERRVWPLLHCFRGTGWNVDMTNEIQAKVSLNAPGAKIKVWLSSLVHVWSKINALPVNTGDHTTSCNAHFPATCIPLCHRNNATVAIPSVMQYIQSWGGSALVHETSVPTA